jgi:hypothetical protein
MTATDIKHDLADGSFKWPDSWFMLYKLIGHPLYLAKFCNLDCALVF